MEGASAARSARGARPLDLKARTKLRLQRSGEGKGWDLEAGKFGAVSLSQEVREGPPRVPPGRVVSEVHRPIYCMKLFSLFGSEMRFRDSWHSC